YIPSRGIRKIPHLSTLLPEFHICKDGKEAEAVVGWGLRPTTHKARAFAAEHQLPFIALEDGFLRSPGLGVAGYPPYSIVYDDIGIYYDTTRPSRLEQLILAAQTEFPASATNPLPSPLPQEREQSAAAVSDDLKTKSSLHPVANNLHGQIRQQPTPSPVGEG
ncbi:capsular polysaccharide export protein, LipB/KpsS family, partial [Neisseria meningitidis]|uniref:capsular polysaccharide export protein, LipB/KpsS family n=1 Tax=Neisseria meningitidis TaxID=487 RepID=UPI003FCE95EE